MAGRIAEVGRRCQRCQYGWFAVPPGQAPAKMRWFDEHAFWTQPEARMTRMTANRDRHAQAAGLFGQCPNCGSRQIHTDKSADFQPTGALAAPSPPPPPPPPKDRSRMWQAQMPSQTDSHGHPITGAARMKGAAWASIWEDITRIHAKHWRIIWAVLFLLVPFGSLSDPDMYQGGIVSDIATGVGIFVGSWAVSALFWSLHIRHRQQQRAEADE